MMKEFIYRGIVTYNQSKSNLADHKPRFVIKNNKMFKCSLRSLLGSLQTQVKSTTHFLSL